MPPSRRQARCGLAERGGAPRMVPHGAQEAVSGRVLRCGCLDDKSIGSTAERGTRIPWVLPDAAPGEWQREQPPQGVHFLSGRLVFIGSRKSPPQRGAHRAHGAVHGRVNEPPIKGGLEAQNEAP